MTGIAVAIVVLLFVIQHMGTKRIAFLFSPIIILWLLTCAGIGIYNLTLYGGEVFKVRPREGRIGGSCNVSP